MTKLIASLLLSTFATLTASCGDAKYRSNEYLDLSSVPPASGELKPKGSVESQEVSQGECSSVGDDSDSANESVKNKVEQVTVVELRRTTGYSKSKSKSRCKTVSQAGEDEDHDSHDNEDDDDHDDHDDHDDSSSV